MLQQFIDNVLHNLFKPLLLFFYAGFLVPILGVRLEFPKAAYQALTIFLLLAIGWHGGEELAGLEGDVLMQALGFMFIGFVTNFFIGILAFYILRTLTRLRPVDAATVAGYYGSDSAGTFVTCLGVLATANIAYAAYMPVMLAVMEIPGCLVALYLVAKMRSAGMDANGYLPGDPQYNRTRELPLRTPADSHAEVESHESVHAAAVTVRQRVQAGVENRTHTVTYQSSAVAVSSGGNGSPSAGLPNNGDESEANGDKEAARELEADLAIEHITASEDPNRVKKSASWLNRELLHEVFLNPGIFLLFAGIAIGFISQKQGRKVTAPDDRLFVELFQGLLCLFLLEMGMTASARLKDLRTAGIPFIAFGLIAPNVFATIGLVITHAYSSFLHVPFELGTYALFAVLCGAASYIAVPAVQRMAIPEASPTLPLAASLGLTFSYNVTLGIPVYLLIAEVLTKAFPVAPIG